MMWLVKGKVTRTEYMGKPYESWETRLVEAEDESEAVDKFKDHFEDRSSEFSVQYHVDYIDAYEVIR